MSGGTGTSLRDVVVLPEQVGLAELAGLRRQLAVAVRRGRDVVVDGRHVERLSTGGQALLVAASRGARLRGNRLVVVQPSARMAEALHDNGLSHLLTGRVIDLP